MIDERDLREILEQTRDLWSDMRGERLFVTGGTGFVGSWLLASLAFANRELRLGARAVVLTRDPLRALRRLAELRLSPDVVDFVQGDATSFSLPAIGTFAFLIHAATHAACSPSPAAPLGVVDAEFAATRRVLDFACRACASKVLYVSSGAVYGRPPPDLNALSEDFCGAPSPLDTDAGYGHAKRLSELSCAMYARTFGLHVTIGRLFAFIGPLLPLDRNFAVGNFLRDVLARSTVHVQGDGTAVRTYLYASDMTVWLWTLLFRGRAGEAYNIGGKESITIADLARLVVARSGVDVPVEVARQASLDGLTDRYVPDVRRAETELGLKCLVSIADGIGRTYAWHSDRAAFTGR